MYVRQCSGAILPQWVYRVDSCPDPSNFSQWINASKRLNCFHKLDSHNPLEQAMVYHCLPSSFLNETVEFCGKNVPIQPGVCVCMCKYRSIDLSVADCLITDLCNIQ